MFMLSWSCGLFLFGSFLLQTSTAREYKIIVITDASPGSV